MIENMNGLPTLATVPLPVHKVGTTNAVRVRAYIQAHDLEAAVNKTVSLALSELPSGSKTLLALTNDGESEETWLVVHLVVNAPRDQIFDIFNGFGDVWIDSVPTAAQHRIHFTYSAESRENSRMDEEKIDELKWLAIWLHEAAKNAGQLGVVRRLIRSAFDDTSDMYGLPEEDEELLSGQEYQQIIGKFAALWDEHDRFDRECTGGEPPNPNPAS